MIPSVYTSKKWEQVAIFEDFSKAAHGVAWGDAAAFIVAVTGDNCVFEYK